MAKRKHPDAVALLDLFEMYRRQKLRGSPHSTLNWYAVMLRAFERYIGHVPTVDDLTNDNVTGFAWQVVELGRSRATANKHGTMLCALWRYACRRELKSGWPDVALPKGPERIPIAWMPDQLAKLFGACQSQWGTIAGIPANLWWHGLHAVIWDTGERISAVLSIRCDSLDLESGWLTVTAENRKGKTRDKTWKLHADTVALLRQLIAAAPEREMLFPWPFSSDYIFNRYARLLKRAGLPHDRKHKFHCLRKSAGSYFEAAGGNATELLGHSSRSVTRNYIDPRVVKQVQASDVLFRIQPGLESATAKLAELAADTRPAVEPAALPAVVEAALPDEPPAMPAETPLPDDSAASKAVTIGGVAFHGRGFKRDEQFSIAGGPWHTVCKSDAKLFRLLLTSESPVSHADIEAAVGRTLSMKARVRVIGRLRAALREALGGVEYDPLPCVGGRGGYGGCDEARWLIQLPADAKGGAA